MHRTHQAHSLLTRSFGSRARIVSFLLALSFGTKAHAKETIQTYAELTLKDGRQFKNVRVVNYTSTGILIRHADGATVIRRDLLSDPVVSEMHLKVCQTAESLDPAYQALADKPAVFENAQTAVLNSVSSAPVAGSMIAGPESHAAAPVGSDALPVMMKAEPRVANAEPTPAGEGNMPEFFANQKAPAATAQTRRMNLSGRVVVTLPSGETLMLADVEIRAYPANLLATYLSQAKARCNEAARKLLEEAMVAERDGRVAERDALTVRARQVVAQYIDYVPEAPYSTRSDAFGYFTLSHALADMRIVAAGKVSVSHEEWNFQWVGVAPEKELLLTEANATSVTVPETNRTRFAAR